MKIGIFLGYGPQVTALGKEGLGRYIGGLLKGFQMQDHEITVACPHWSVKAVEDLAKDFYIDTDKIKWITTKNDPPLWKLYQWLNRKRKTHNWEKIKHAIRCSMDRLAQRFATAHSWSGFLGRGLLYGILGLVLMPPAAILYLLSVLTRLFLKLLRKIKNKFRIKVINKILSIWGKEDYQLQLFDNMTSGELRYLCHLINTKESRDVWFVPSIFWPEVNKIIRGTVVINSPDLLTQEFPQGFAESYHAKESIALCRKTIEEGTYFIAYSEFLRKSLLLEQYGKDERKTKAIPHVNNAMDSYLEVDPKLKMQNNLQKDQKETLARLLVAEVWRGVANELSYAVNIRPDEIHYIFYSSQIRYSKNMLNLVKAYEYLLRKKFVHFKLLLTANFDHHPQFRQYIQEHRLENEVISCYNVPARTLAALYRCADLVVNPTLYEGGFPFTFGEGMSVGTPSIMSDIPQVRDVLEPAGLEEIMFDPYDWKAIADKILWALEHRDELYQKELPLYREMEKRTPAVVAAEYVDAFEQFITQDRKRQDAKAV